MAKFVLDDNATANKSIASDVESFLSGVTSLETKLGNSIILHQDGVENSYFIRVCLPRKEAAGLLDLDARLIPESDDSFRANRELRLKHQSFITMARDATNGREFNDIIVEYNTEYSPEKPLKVWGGQHRSKAIQAASQANISRNHGFRVYFGLTKQQRSALALISNTNINVSNDLFDRQIEETIVGPHLRQWCAKVFLLGKGEDFPDAGSRSERITTNLARTFIVNFFEGIHFAANLPVQKLDMNYFEPYLCKSGILDDRYESIINKEKNLWKHKGLIEAGTAFSGLHKAQFAAVDKSKISRKSFKMKTLTVSVLSGWAFIAGLLQSHEERLSRHLIVPKSPKGSADPLNAVEMSVFKHDQDPRTYRGLGTRAEPKDRQRMAQVFLARTAKSGQVLDKKLLYQAVSVVVGLKSLSKGYL